MTQDNTNRDRLSSDARRGLALILLAATSGACAICGDTLLVDAPASHPKRLQMSHVRPALGSSREGWSSGNLFAGCGACNDWAGKRDITGTMPAWVYPHAAVVWSDADARQAGKGTNVRKASGDAHEDLRSRLECLI